MALRPNNPVMMNAVANTTGAKVSSALDAANLMSGSVQAFFSDAAAAGTLVIQGSNDPYEQLSGSIPPQNWTNVPGATATVSSGGSVLIPLNASSWSAPCRWLRVQWTRSAGAGTITVNGMFQGLS